MPIIVVFFRFIDAAALRIKPEKIQKLDISFLLSYSVAQKEI